MKNQVKEKYLAPQIEVIQMETEGTSCVIAGSGNLGGFGNGGSIGTSSRSYGRSRGSRNASSSELEDLINDILTIVKNEQHENKRISSKHRSDGRGTGNSSLPK